ncbi:hypothetical protein SAMN00777080_0432 [Aquiflexum balticum DSM 16537]|uniref:Outer membrane protein beta-barrel domain-containing protein n=1 Tax=Aquiflexum balticum DSM 16537 TaxID=758820 RepID=A0A1W2GZU6_9BACT|nr:hypothetical protein [Aquiflexum balticum]SMD41898.1 hypothetical protein SAMN00777080_0432 [Aquiflexum balticum DSM 16537]
MKTKPTLIMAILVCLLQSVSIQAQEASNSERWEVGIDALSLIEKNEYPPISVFLLRKIGENGISLRSRLGYSRSSFQNLTAIPGQFPTPNDKISREIFGLLGMQKEIVRNLGIGKNSDLYVGLDFAMLFKEEFHKKFYGEFVSFYYDESKYSDKKYTISPFLGVSKQIGNHFSVRVEMAILFQRSNFKYSAESFILDDYDFTKPFDPSLFKRNDPSSKGYGKNQTNSVITSPINQFIFSYKF